MSIRLEDIPLDAKYTPEMRERLIAEAEDMLREIERKGNKTESPVKAAPAADTPEYNRVAHGA